MKGKALASALAGATLATGAIMPHLNKSDIINKNISNNILLGQGTSQIQGKSAVVINGNNELTLFNNSKSKSTYSYLSVGEMLTVLGKENNLYKVKVEETGSIGYISSSNLQIITSGIGSPLKELTANGSIINVTTDVHLRINPSMSSNVLMNLKEGTKFKILGTKGQWIRVDVNNTIGYIYSPYVHINNKSVTKLTTSSTGTSINGNKTTKNTNSQSSTNKISVKATTSISPIEVNNNIKTNSSNTIKGSPAIPLINLKKINMNDLAFIKAESHVSLFSGPSYNFSTSKTFHNEKVNVTVLYKSNNFYAVKLPNGTLGYINQNYIEFSGNGSKSQYLNKLNNLAIKTFSLLNDNPNNLDLYSSKALTIWNNQLTTMYNSLMKVLPTNDANELESSQESFINSISTIVPVKISNFNKETIKNVQAECLTQERCFELANLYPELYYSSVGSLSLPNNKINSAKTTTNNKTNNNIIAGTTNKKSLSNNSSSKAKIVTEKNSVAKNNNETSKKKSNIKATKNKTTSPLALENKTITNLGDVDVQSGESYFSASKLAKKYEISSNHLNQLIYNHICSAKIPCSNYIYYDYISNIVNNGTKAEKKALLSKYGPNCLVIKLQQNARYKEFTPSLFYKGNFYYEYSCVNLYELLNNPSKGFKYSGVINSLGETPSISAYNQATTEKGIYHLALNTPTWSTTKINC